MTTEHVVQSVAAQGATIKGQVVPLKDKLKTLETQVTALIPRMALPQHLRSDRMARVVVNSATMTPKLLECDRASFLRAIMIAASLGLEPNGALGDAYLVPFKDKVQLIIGYKGLIALARRSGQISTIQATLVHDDDVFEYELGLEPRIRHVPAKEPTDGRKVTHVYAVARLKDGGVQFVVMAKSEVDARRTRSRSGNDGPWATDYGAMAQKTALRELSKLLPMSVEWRQAVTYDDLSERGLPEAEFVVMDVPDLSDVQQ